MRTLAIAIAMALGVALAIPTPSEARPRQSQSKVVKKDKKKLYEYRCSVYKKKKRYRKYRRWKRYCGKAAYLRKLEARKLAKQQQERARAYSFLGNILQTPAEDDNSAAAFFRRDKIRMSQSSNIDLTPEPVLSKKVKRNKPKPYRWFRQSPVAIARKYEGMNARRNRGTLKTVLNVDPMRIPWCAAFANAMLARAGYEGTGSLMARSFLNYGQKTWNPSQGDIVVFKRGRSRRSGHVGFYMGEETIRGVQYILVLGGNQRRSVNVAYYPKRKVLGYRRIT
jgi:uncharacterized protein (TIGR02594 family)